MEKHEKKSTISRRNFFDKTARKLTAFAAGMGAGLLLKRSRTGFSSQAAGKPNSQTQQQNPYEYNIDDLKIVDSALITYKEIDQRDVDLEELRGLTVDADDNLFVTGDTVLLGFDKTGNRIQKMDLNHPAYGLTVDKNNQFYLCMKDHVEIMDENGSQVEEMHSLGEQAYLTSIALSDQHIYMADAGNRILWQFSKSGMLLNRFGEKDPEQGIPGLVIPSPYMDVAVDDSGDIWVANTGRHSLEKYNVNGELITRWGTASMRIEYFCGCCNPTHFALLRDGSFVTSEKGLPRVKIYDKEGSFKTVVAEPAQFDEGTVGLDLAVDSQDRIYVLDPKRKTVRIFSQTSLSLE